MTHRTIGNKKFQAVLVNVPLPERTILSRNEVLRAGGHVPFGAKGTATHFWVRPRKYISAVQRVSVPLSEAIVLKSVAASKWPEAVGALSAGRDRFEVETNVSILRRKVGAAWRYIVQAPKEFLETVLS